MTWLYLRNHTWVVCTPHQAQESPSEQPSQCKPEVKPSLCYSYKERTSCEFGWTKRQCVERGHGEEGCFEYVVLWCLRSIAVGSSVMRQEIFVAAVVDRYVNTPCLHMSHHHMNHQHQSAKAGTWREKTRRAKDLLKKPSARRKGNKRLFRYLSWVQKA